MNDLIFKEIEDILIGENGILIDLRYGNGLNNYKVQLLFDKLERVDIKNLNSIPKSFFHLMIDSVVLISSSADSNDANSILLFLDKFVDKLKD